jgi:glutaredoxin
MQLTKLDAAVLERLCKYRAVAPTLGERLKAMSAWTGLVLLLCVAATVALARLDLPGVAFIPAGVFLGALCRDIASQQRFVKAWPLNNEVMDWARVEQLLATAKTAPQAPPPAKKSKTRVSWAVGVGVGAAAVVIGIVVGTDQALAYAYNPTRHNPPDGVIVLTASWCPYCESLRHHLLEHHIPYTELDVDHTTEGRFGFTAVRGTGIPITIVGKQVIRGVGKKGTWEKIDAALGKAGYSVSSPPDSRPPT